MPDGGVRQCGDDGDGHRHIWWVEHRLVELEAGGDTHDNDDGYGGDPNYEWEQLLDIDDSDLPLTIVLCSCNNHVCETTTTTTTQNTTGIVQVEENTVRIIPGPAGIVQLAKLRKQSDIHEGGDDFVLSTQEYIKKVIKDVDEGEDFKGGSWVSAVEFVIFNGGCIVNGCLGDIKNYIKNGKLEQLVAIIKSCTPNAIGDLTVTLKDLLGTIHDTIHHKVIDERGYGKDITVGSALILDNVSVFSPKPSMHYLNITMRNVIKVCWNVTHHKMAHEEALNLALEEEARQAHADQEWLEKCRKEAELDEEHERQLWRFYGTI
nr:hypothetical protein [Tanacetum cinerariifolium]